MGQRLHSDAEMIQITFHLSLQKTPHTRGTTADRARPGRRIIVGLVNLDPVDSRYGLEPTRADAGRVSCRTGPPLMPG